MSSGLFRHTLKIVRFWHANTLDMVEVYVSDTGDYIIRLAFPFPILLELITWRYLWFHVDAILGEQNWRDELWTSFLDVPDFCNIIVIFSVILVIFILLLYPLRLFIKEVMRKNLNSFLFCDSKELYFRISSHLKPCFIFVCSVHQNRSASLL